MVGTILEVLCDKDRPWWPLKCNKLLVRTDWKMGRSDSARIILNWYWCSVAVHWCLYTVSCDYWLGPSICVVCLHQFMSACLCWFAPACLSVRLFLWLFVCLPVFLPVYLSVCVSENQPAIVASKLFPIQSTSIAWDSRWYSPRIQTTGFPLTSTIFRFQVLQNPTSSPLQWR